MSVVSLDFIFFIAVCLLFYYIVPKKTQWFILLFFSMAFYAVASGIMLTFVFGGLILFNWAGALAIGKYSEDQRIKKAAYTLTVVIDLVVLVIFKDINFFPDTFNAAGKLLGSTLTISRISILAPIGISYYTLILIGYVTEVYWGKFSPQQNIGKFMLFAGYFPIMTSGPFIKYDETGAALLEQHKFSYKNILFGAERILWGFFKKLIIAERLGVIVSTVYSDYSVYGGWYVLVAVVCFVLQLYTDFSGAIDIALGVSECFGITLPENFSLPFWSVNLSEFWRRWHITLGSWLREYVFYPVLRSGTFRKLKKWCRKKLGKDYEKKFNLPVYLGMFITWFLIGFWHGGRWNYIFGSGLYYWFLITLGEVCMPFLQRVVAVLQINTECSSYRMFQRFRTFCIFVVGLSFFRASSLQSGVMMWKEVFTGWAADAVNNGTVLGLGLDAADVAVLIAALAILAAAGLLRVYLQQSIRGWLNRQNMLFKGSVITVALLCVVVFGIYGPGVTAAEFIYQQF